jgi:hypothetical protein
MEHHVCAVRRAETGATLVEFALVAPVVFMLIFGIISGCFLAYQNSALHDGATAGARMASIESQLVALNPTNGLYCESGSPVSIEKAVAQATPLLKVNPAPLCATSAGASQLTQGPDVPGDVNITVTCGGGCASPTSTLVALAFSTKGLVAPIGLTYHLTATSQDPVLSP